MPGSPETSQVFERAIQDHLAVIESVRAQQPVPERIAAEITRAVLAGNKVLWCGNGGSAADSQHLAAEFVDRFRRDRKGPASVPPTTDTSIRTSIGSDYGFEQAFRRQKVLCVKGDVPVGISTSGNSRNVCLALDTARNLGPFTVACTGQGGGAMAGVADAILSIASKDTARIQETHILSGHILCDWMEMSVCAREPELDTAAR